MEKNNKQYNYYITKDNDDGSKEVVARINGSREQAEEQFLKVIKEQQQEYHVLKTLPRWRKIRLFDSNDNQLRQES